MKTEQEFNSIHSAILVEKIPIIKIKGKKKRGDIRWVKQYIALSYFFGQSHLLDVTLLDKSKTTFRIYAQYHLD